MDLQKLLYPENEKPLDNIVCDGGYARIFRTVGCIGDSLSSGEFESRDAAGNIGYHDFYEYSWGQYIARNAGITVYNFSRGGMTAKEFMESFADSCGVWSDEKKCQAYILALGVNEIYQKMPVGTIADVDTENPQNNKPTFAGYYAQIISRLKTIQPDAKFFLVNTPSSENGEEGDAHAKVLEDMTRVFDNAYVIDLRKYGPAYDAEFRKNFYLGGHLNAAGYIFTAQIITSYIDYIVRHNFEDFAQTGFIGTPFKYN